MTGGTITVRGLVCRLGGQDVLGGVDLDVDPGEFVSILGPNGAGKSTLLKSLVRIVRQSAGAITISGRRLETYSQRELARVIGYVPQADARYVPLRGLEFVLMGRYPHLSPFSSITPDDTRAAEKAL